MDFHDVELYGDLTKESTELLGPITKSRIKASISALMSYRNTNEREDFRVSHRGLIADVVSNAGNSYSPEIGGDEQISMYNLIDGGNYWTTRIDFSGKYSHCQFPLGVGYCLTAGGQNTGGLPYNALTERYFDTDNTWTSRTACFQIARLAGFSLTTDYGIVAGGQNASYEDEVERYSDSANTWTSRTNMSGNMSALGGSGLTSNLGIVFGGFNLTSTISDARRYSNSGNSWTVRTDMSEAKTWPGSISISQDSCVCAGGNNGSITDTTERYNDSADSWTSRTAMYARQDHATMSFSSTWGNVVSGVAVSGITTSNHRFCDSSNNWATRTDILVGDQNIAGSSIGNNQGIVSGGYNTSTRRLSVSRFKESLGITFDDGLSLSSYKHPNNEVPYNYKTVVETNELTDTTTQIKYVVVSALYGQGESSDISPVLLLHMDDTDLSDSSPSEHVVSKNGDAARSGTESQFGNYSAYFDGDDYLSIPDSADWDFGSGDFTIDCWVNIESHDGAGISSILGQGHNTEADWLLRYYSGNLEFNNYDGGSFNISMQCSWSPTLDEWYHVAISRSGSTWRMFINGSQIGSDYINSESITNSPGTLSIGRGAGGSNWRYFNGYIDEVRISKGIARWTSDFEVPTSAYGSSDTSIEEPTFDVTLDGEDDDGVEYGLTDQPLDSLTDLSTLSPSGSDYKLRLRFNLPRDVQGDSWSSRANKIEPMNNSAPISLSSDEYVTAGGSNGGYRTTVEKYSNSENSWSSRTGLPSVRMGNSGISLTSDQGVSCGGHDGGDLSNVDRYSDSVDIWLSRTVVSSARYSARGISLTTDLGIVSGGAYVKNTTERYSDSANTWTSVGLLQMARYQHASFSLTTNEGIFACGNNGTQLDTVERYSNSDNQWTNRTVSIIPRESVRGFSNHSERGMVVGGNYGGYLDRVEQYINSSNIWILKQEYPISAEHLCASSLGSFHGIVAGGGNGGGNTFDNTYSYTDGETTFTGFAVQTLS